MRDVLEAVAAGEISIDEAEVALAGYATGDVGRFDAARETRRGVPEGILAPGKTPTEVATLVGVAVETTGHAIATRTTASHRTAITERLGDTDAHIDSRDRSGTVVVHAGSYEPPTLAASVGIVTAGTADAGPAEEASVVAEEMGASIHRLDDVGVANLTRVTDRLDDLRELDVLIVAAGREGALPTVVAGLVNTPVIGLPISTGYGYGGDGEAALAGMLQSCTVLSVVNIDAGFVAGAQAGLIAQAIDAARTHD